MTSRDFCYWLQGFFEISEPYEINDEQTKLIKSHLAMVFRYEIDPSFPKEDQDDLNHIHLGNTKIPGKIKPLEVDVFVGGKDCKSASTKEPSLSIEEAKELLQKGKELQDKFPKYSECTVDHKVIYRC